MRAAAEELSELSLFVKHGPAAGRRFVSTSCFQLPFRRRDDDRIAQIEPAEAWDGRSNPKAIAPRVDRPDGVGRFAESCRVSYCGSDRSSLEQAHRQSLSHSRTYRANPIAHRSSK
jgi:hypothetical protein